LPTGEYDPAPHRALTRHIGPTVHSAGIPYRGPQQWDVRRSAGRAV